MEMTQTANTKTQTSPRFLVAGKELVYKLFDAFLKKTVIEDKAIDFSKPVVQNEDGTVEFAGLDRSFTELMCGKPVEHFDLKEKPERLRGESDEAYQKRFAKFDAKTGYTEKDQEQKDYISACQEYRDSVYNFLSEALPKEPEMLNLLKEPKKPEMSAVLKTYKEIPVPQKEEGETDRHFQKRMDAYNLKLQKRQAKCEAKFNALLEHYNERLDKVREENQKREPEIDTLKADYEKEQKEFFEKYKDIFPIALHLHWLWSLGAKDIATGCGLYGKIAKINYPAASTDGVWDVPSSRDLAKNLVLMYCILERFLSWPNRPVFNSVDEVKNKLIHYVFKERKESEAPIRNGLLHLCDPDKYINFYSYEEKVTFVENYSKHLYDYDSLNGIEYREQDSLYYSMQFGTKDDRTVYQANRTEEKICHIYDKLHIPVA